MYIDRFVVPGRRGFVVEGVREPVIVCVFRGDRWPSVRGSFSLAGEDVRFSL